MAWTEEKKYDVVVVGGGIAGVCAALACSRNGAKTAIVQSRSVWGGNASSEIRMHIMGAGCHNSKKNLNESGILLELLLENKHRNPFHNYSIWDSILWEKVRFQENLDSYLNTTVDAVEVISGSIQSARAYQSTTETEFILRAEIFVDATGHGTVGVLSGAANRTGSEGRIEFNEATAPEIPNNFTMGNTIMFQAANRGKPVKFIRPFWAKTYTEEDLKYRTHYFCTKALGEGGRFEAYSGGETKALPDFSTFDSGYWWIELGGDYDDIIRSGEDIRDELLKVLYGVWDHIKNQGDHGADNYDLEWVGMVPGARESRRLEGPYILTENDVRTNRIFDDAVAYGGWPMDVHTPGGMHDLDKLPSAVHNFDGSYTIPYRCYYSRNITNLMMAGRNVSLSKLAFSSARVMGTCAVGGQAVGTACAIAVKNRILPSQVDTIRLQQQLLLQDCYIPGVRNLDELDFAPKCSIKSNGHLHGGQPKNVVNGIAREVGEDSNVWESKPLQDFPAILQFTFDQRRNVSRMCLYFDPNLSREIMPSITSLVRDRQCQGMPEELVRDYRVVLKLNGMEVYRHEARDNYQRYVTLNIDKEADEACIEVMRTYGYPSARIFEVRLYE